jgi:hypothetical protein
MRLPDSITKRDILFGARRTRAGEILALAKAYAAAGHLSDATDFFAKVDASEEIGALVSTVIEEGDMFLLLKMHRLIGEERVPHEVIRQCAEKAQALGKTRYAIMGFEKLGDEAKAEALRDTIADDGDIVSLRESDTFVAANLEEIQDSEDVDEA